MTSTIVDRLDTLIARPADFVALTKPRVTGLVVLTALTGVAMAPGTLELSRAVGMLASTWILVASANALNCYLERDSDRCMARTANRPLPSGRMHARLALAWGLALLAFSLPALWIVSNALTALLGLVAHLTYVLAYTPMKRTTVWSTPVGCIPGAMPPLMGFTAVTGTLDPTALLLFAFVAMWQMPHTIAIGIFRRADYQEARLKVIPAVMGNEFSQRLMELTTIDLVAISLAFTVLGAVGTVYSTTALLLGAALVLFVLRGPRRETMERWAKRVFLFSMVHFAVLLVLLAVDAR